MKTSKAFMVVMAGPVFLSMSAWVQSGGPKVGDIAPDFKLNLLTDSEKEIQLSRFKGNKPVVLIFGSYT